MHIMEGYLPREHAFAWMAATAPFVAYGVWRLKKQMRENPANRLLLGAAGGFTFILSALKIPSFTGSCSHPTGIGMGTILFGPGIMTVVGCVVLLFQALLLAHGGLTTFGANAFAMAVVGPYVAYGLFKSLKRINIKLAVFISACLSDLSSYLCTTLQLALAFPDPVSGFYGACAKFGGIFAVTQIPLAITEGLLTVLVVDYLMKNSREDLVSIGFIKDAAATPIQGGSHE